MGAVSKQPSHSSVTIMRFCVRAASTASNFSDLAWRSRGTKSRRQHDRDLIFFRVEIEDQIFTWSSNFSCETSPVSTTQVLIPIDQKLRRVLGVSSVYLCQFAADVAFRRCSIRYWTFLESRCSLNIEYGQTLRGSACPHLRALFIHLKDHSKQANELLHEPHTASF